MAAKVVQNAKFRPGKCAVTGDLDGPFIDTGRKIPQYGVIYLSIPGISGLLRDHGFLHGDEADALLEDNERLQDEVRRLTEIESAHQELVDAVSPYIEVEPEVHEVTVPTERAPTDEEIERWIESKGGNHPAVLRARPHEKGSPEEWRELYGDVPPGHPEFSKAPTSSRNATLAQELSSQDANAVVQVNKSGTRIVVIHEQDVDLYEVLDQNVNDVLDWADGHEDGVHEALLDAEYERAREQKRNPRKSLIEGLGYEYVDPEIYHNDPVGPEDVRDNTVTSITENRGDEVAVNVHVGTEVNTDEDDEDVDFSDVENDDEDGEEE